MAKVYKSKKIIMPLGLLAIAVAVGVAGCLLSFVYLKINEVCPSVYLCAICAFGFGALMGGIAYLLIKIMKIRSPITALIGAIIGCLVFTVFKWGLYVQWDNEKIYENYYETTLESHSKESAFEYFEFVYYFSDESEKICSSDEIDKRVSEMQKRTAAEFAEEFSGSVDAFIALAKAEGINYTKQELKSTSSFDFFYDGYVDEDDITGSIEKAYKMNVKEYYNEVLKNNIRDAKYLATHPTELFENIKEINEYGRWALKSRHTYSYINNEVEKENNNIKGIMLWIVWIGEMLLICIPAIVIAHKRAAMPFIESNKKWAEKNNSDAFMLKAPILVAGVGKSFKNSPDSVFGYEHLPVRPGNAPHLRLELYHSDDYEENYASLILKTYNAKNKRFDEKIVAKYVTVDKSFVYRFFKHCNQDVPFAYSEYYTQPTATMEEIPNPVSTDEKTQDEIFKELNS